MSDDDVRRARWRLVLGAEAAAACAVPGGGTGDAGEPLSDEQLAQDRALTFLYERETGSDRRSGGLGGGDGLTVSAWINDVRELFPRRVVERLEHDALDRYGLLELVTDAEVLRQAQPSMTMLKAVLSTKHLMKGEVLDEARRIIRAVVDELRERLAREVVSPFAGTLDRRRPTRHKVAANFDAKATIRRNLKHFDLASGRIVINQPLFSSRVRRHVDRWQVIVLVDQSGSMVDSVIHAAVTASVFTALGTLMDTHLVVFDDRVVDLTERAGDPVETLLAVQLGGGTDIAQAMAYAAQLVTRPDRALVVLITDFCEGGAVGPLLATTKALIESGVTVLGLAALDADAVPGYDRGTASRIAALGAHVGAMTPHELAVWVAERVA
ncbi:VWA domain-containing protein [Conexibacter woesei]|uniref:VWA domain-containing protein n=1 Tax=Conexibacter woesei TaxID=191495 RepID=UPI0003FD710C|nr:VWA domain-containing protein [Conexibacter woesei]